MSPEQTPSGTDFAVVDRITEGSAVLLVGDEEAEATVPAGELPDGAREGAWLRVRRGSGGTITVVEIDHEGTARQRSAMQGRLDKLQQERGGGRFGH